MDKLDQILTELAEIKAILLALANSQVVSSSEETKSLIKAVLRLTPSVLFRHPTASEVTEYAKSLDYELDGESFIDHYDAVGWVYGKSRKPVKSWKACVRTWCRSYVKKYPQKQWHEAMEEK